MRTLKLISIVEQVADHLKDEILRGALTGTIPGSKTLAVDLGVNHKTVNTAILLLEKQGFIITQGVGKRRQINRPKNSKAPALRISILPFAPEDAKIHYTVELQHRLNQVGHNSTIVSSSLTELKMDPKRVAQFVKQCDADAWVVISGSNEVLQWFADQPFPTFALFGNLGNIPLASIRPDKGPAFLEVTNRLIRLGHSRIVILSRKENLTPEPPPIYLDFLKLLEAHGIKAGRYNLPLWENDPESLQDCLSSLFRHTPPTAMLIEEVSLFYIVQQFLSKRDILAPRDISLICNDPDPSFTWCRPRISHINYDSLPWIQRIAKWANNVSRGKEDQRKTMTKVDFYEGETIGLAPK